MGRSKLLAVQAGSSRALVMLKALLPLAALVAVSAAHAQDSSPPAEAPALSLEQQTSLRCAVAFASLASAQDMELEWATQYPPIETRGKEFFVRSLAKIMEDERFTRDVVSRLVEQETQRQIEGGPKPAEDMMSACLALLDASGI